MKVADTVRVVRPKNPTPGWSSVEQFEGERGVIAEISPENPAPYLVHFDFEVYSGQNPDWVFAENELEAAE